MKTLADPANSLSHGLAAIRRRFQVPEGFPPAVLADDLKPLLDGIERADSVALDPHKTLFLPYGTGAVLVRDGRLLQDAFSASADYLRPLGESEVGPSPADLSPELTRHFRAMRLWPAILTVLLAASTAFANKPPKALSVSDITAHLAPVANVAQVPLLIVVHPALPAASIAEFVALAKRAGYDGLCFNCFFGSAHLFERPIREVLADGGYCCW